MTALMNQVSSTTGTPIMNLIPIDRRFGGGGLSSSMRLAATKLAMTLAAALRDVSDAITDSKPASSPGGAPASLRTTQNTDAASSDGATSHPLTAADDDRIVEALISALVDGDEYWPPDGEDAYYDPEYRYFLMEGDLGKHGQSWADFRRSLMFDQRFFNPDAERWLTEIFSGVQQQRNAAGQGPVYLIQPNEDQASFFRARVANSESEAEAILADLAGQLGPPPEHLRRAGRLNPAGIPAFYAAFDLATCVAELRPSVGGGVVAAQFHITEPICVLDTTRFAEGPRAPNLFAPKALERGRQWRFMQMFMGEIGRAVFPSDEHLDYLPTQVVAEFLNKRFRVSLAGEQRPIDAVIFSSAQRPRGKNIVLLGDAAIVGNPDGSSRKAPPSDVFDDWLESELAKAKPGRVPRIVPRPDSFVSQRVTSAEFQTEARAVPNDEDDFENDMEVT